MRKTLLTVLIAAILSFIWGNSLVPGEESGKMSNAVMVKLNAMAAGIGLPDDTFTYYADTDGDGILEPTGYLVRKLAHMTEYALLAALVWLRLEKRGRMRALHGFFICAAVAGTDELIQRFSVNRGPQLTDVLIDSFGAALGLLICSVFSWLLVANC